MDERILAGLSGAVQGVERATNNIMNIKIKAYEIGQEKEKFDLFKKKTKLEIQEAEQNLDPEMASLNKQIKEAQIKQAEGTLEHTKALTDATLVKTTQEKKTADDILKESLGRVLSPMQSLDSVDTQAMRTSGGTPTGEPINVGYKSKEKPLWAQIDTARKAGYDVDATTGEVKTKEATTPFAWNTKRDQLYKDVESGVITQDQADKALGQDIDKDDELSFEQKERVKLGIRTEENIIGTFEGTEKCPGYLEKDKFNHKEKKEAEYMLQYYNQIKEKKGFSPLEFVKEKAGVWGPVGDYWKLYEAEGQETEQESSQMGNIQEKNGGKYILGEDNVWHLISQ